MLGGDLLHTLTGKAAVVNATVSKLREMRLSVMANALKDQLADPQFQSMVFEDRSFSGCGMECPKE